MSLPSIMGERVKWAACGAFLLASGIGAREMSRRRVEWLQLLLTPAFELLKYGLGVSFSEARLEASSDGFEGTTVECEAGAGDVGCGVGEEKRCGLSKFGDVAVAAQGNRLYGIGSALFRRHPGAFGARAVEASDPVGIDPARHDIIHADAFWSELDGERLDQTCYAGSHDI
jgi:hypothetical protein